MRLPDESRNTCTSGSPTRGIVLHGERLVLVGLGCSQPSVRHNQPSCQCPARATRGAAARPRTRAKRRGVLEQVRSQVTGARPSRPCKYVPSVTPAHPSWMKGSRARPIVIIHVPGITLQLLCLAFPSRTSVLVCLLHVLVLVHRYRCVADDIRVRASEDDPWFRL